MITIPGPLGILLLAVKVLLMLFTFALIFGFFYALYKGWHYRPEFKVDKEQAKKTLTLRDTLMKERWESIIKKFALGTPEAARLSVIEADALVDTALKNAGIEGEHLADRLSNLDPQDVKTINRAWRAHRMRNDLVHTPGFAIGMDGAKMALQDYEAFLEEIEVL